METVLHYRQSIVELLQDLAALNAGAGPVELVCGWFDDLYAPAESSQHSASEAWAQHLKAWKACFSQSELVALESFNSTFESLEKNLDMDPLSFASDSNWHKVSGAASEALLAFQTHVA